MKLTQDQELIIQEMRFLANRPIESARRLNPKLKNKSAETIRRSLQRATQYGLLTVVPHLDVGSLDLTEIVLLCSTQGAAQSGSSSTLISEHQWVHEVVRTTGNYDLMITLRVSNLSDISEFLEDLSSMGLLVKERKVACITGCCLFSRNYFNHSGKRHSLIKNYSKAALQLHPTEIDLALQLLPKPIASKTRLAQELGVSRGLLIHRLNTLEQKGVLTGWSYELEAHMLGKQCYDLLLTLSSYSTSTKDQLIEFAISSPGVTMLRSGAGGFDFHIAFECSSAQELHSFKNSLTAQLETKLTDLIVLNRWERRFRQQHLNHLREIRNAA